MDSSNTLELYLWAGPADVARVVEGLPPGGKPVYSEPGVATMVSVEFPNGSLSLSFFADGLKARGWFIPTAANDAEELIRRLAKATSASYGFADFRKALSFSPNPLLLDPGAPVRPYDAYEWNVFGPERVVHTSSQEERAALKRALAPMLPAISEWLPCSQQREANVDDADAVIRHYRNDLAEELVMAFHTEIPEIMEASRNSLILLDRLFWRESYAEKFNRGYIDGTLARALGAYLGMVVADELDGEWIPRAEMAESQVRIKDRVWLPFARAGRFLKSGEASWDHSLTAFYDAAEDAREEMAE